MGCTLQLRQREKYRSGIKVLPLPSRGQLWDVNSVRRTVYWTCYRFTESIRKLLRWPSSGSAHIFLGEGGRGRDRERDCMHLQPLSSAAWLVAIATWLCIPFHLPFLINPQFSLPLVNLALSWNASPLRLTYLRGPPSRGLF